MIGLYLQVSEAVHDAGSMTGAEIRKRFAHVPIERLQGAVRNAVRQQCIHGPLSYALRANAIFKARNRTPQKNKTGRRMGGAIAVAIARGEVPPDARPKRDYPPVRASRDDRPVQDRSHLWPELMGNAEFEDDPRSLAERHALWRRPVPPHRLFSVTGCAAAMLVASR